MFKNLIFTSTVIYLLATAVLPLGGSLYSYKRYVNYNPFEFEMSVDLLERTDVDILSTYEI